MIGYKTNLTPELQNIAIEIEEIAKNEGLDFFPTIFELIDYKQLNEIAAYGGFPTRYKHWRWGMAYEQLSKSYEYGLSLIYEMVINTNPCYAYLLRANSMVHQKTVIAHVYGHADFFKNNYWFSKTNRKMLDKMANNAFYIQRFIDEIGEETVENFIDVCLSLDNLIDMNSPFLGTDNPKEDIDIDTAKKDLKKIKSKKYMDSYINPTDSIKQQNVSSIDTQNTKLIFPKNPEKDVLKFLLDYAPLEAWQEKILEIIRSEAYYFAPQGRTKIINEGWATYWHSKFMTKLYPLNPSEIVDYCESYSGIVASSGQLNPYKLGLELIRHVESRWNKGQYGKEYQEQHDFKDRKNWDTNAGNGRKKIFEIRKTHNDLTFIDQFLDEDFCYYSKMFLYDYDKKNNRYVISSRNFKDIKQKLLSSLTNFGQPIIKIVDGNFKNRNELLLKHDHEESDLKYETALETLRNLHVIWQRPVHILTIAENEVKRISFDGKTHHVEKVK